MTTFADDILEAACGEPILQISIGSNREGWVFPTPDHELGNEPVDWDVAKPTLDYKYDSGFGGQDCHNILAWTETRVLFVHEYDGSTWVRSVPRNPSAYKDTYDD